jgi:hypothetical protein
MIDNRDEQFSKHHVPMEVTVFGIVIDDKDEKLENQLFLIDEIEGEMKIKRHFVEVKWV